MCASANMANYAIKMTKFEVNGNLVMLQPGSSQLFSENDFIMKCEVDQSSMSSPSFLVFHYYLEGDVDVAHYTTSNVLFNAQIKMLQMHCIYFEDASMKPTKVKGDGSCLYRAVDSHIMLFCLHGPWSERFPPGKKSGIKPATLEVMKDLKSSSPWKIMKC